jgi:uncharacterized protein YegP (UPF0339 family)
MAGKHSKSVFEVKKIGGSFRVVFSHSGNIVAGTPGYDNKYNAQEHANSMNDKAKKDS